MKSVHTGLDLSTNYLGLKLKNPLVASASPLSEDLGGLRRLEDSGIAAVVNYSLFEEEIEMESRTLHNHLTQGTESFPEALSYFPESLYFETAPEIYYEHLRRAKESLEIPLIASLNGYTLGGWTKYASLVEEAGVDALELNLYHIPTDPDQDSAYVEELYLDIVSSVTSATSLPVAVKLSPFFTSLPNMACRLEEAGASGLVLFNRFYQPDIDPDRLQAFPNLILSSSADNRLPLRWIAILHGLTGLNLAATSGIHQAEDVLKMVMVGADVTMLCATLLKNGVAHAAKILADLKEWMEENEYQSISQMRGSMSHRSSADPEAFERANYMKALRSYKLS